MTGVQTCALPIFDHPEASVVNLSNTSHVITEVWWKGNDLMGKLQLLPTPSGNIAKALVMAGIPLGISSRGMGSVKQLGETVEVQDDFELICFDLVSSPSTPGAYLYLNKEDRPKYEEKLAEHDATNFSGGGLEKSVDLMKGLTDYLK